MAVRQYYSRERAWPSKFGITKNSSILDIGCGTGVLGKYLKQNYNAVVTGIELLQDCALIAEKTLDKVYCENIESTDILSDLTGFDYVIFSDSLEHLLEPEKVLRKIAPVLKNADSSVLISIPNVRNFRVIIPLIIFGEWKYEEEGLLDRTHLRFFTKKSMTRTLSENGYQITHVKCELPLDSLSGKLNFITFGLFEGFLTSHYYIQACRKKY